MRFHLHRLFTWQWIIWRRAKYSIPLITGLIGKIRALLPLWIRTKLRRWLSTGDAGGYVVLTADPTPAANISICWSLNLSYADTLVHQKTEFWACSSCKEWFQSQQDDTPPGIWTCFLLRSLSWNAWKELCHSINLGNGNPIDWCDKLLCQNQTTPKRPIDQCPTIIGCKIIGHLQTIRKKQKLLFSSIDWTCDLQCRTSG